MALQIRVLTFFGIVMEDPSGAVPRQLGARRIAQPAIDRTRELLNETGEFRRSRCGRLGYTGGSTHISQPSQADHLVGDGVDFVQVARAGVQPLGD